MCYKEVKDMEAKGKGLIILKDGSYETQCDIELKLEERGIDNKFEFSFFYEHLEFRDYKSNHDEKSLIDFLEIVIRSSVSPIFSIVKLSKLNEAPFGPNVALLVRV